MLHARVGVQEGGMEKHLGLVGVGVVMAAVVVLLLGGNLVVGGVFFLGWLAGVAFTLLWG